MSELYGYRNSLLAQDGKLAGSRGCCCSGGDPNDEPPPDFDPDDPNPDPPGPNCGCGVFSDCTVQVVYEGLTLLVPLNQQGSTNYHKEAGSTAYQIGLQFGAFGAVGIRLSVLTRGNCTNNAVLINGACGIPSVSVLYHFSLLYGTTGFVASGTGLKNQWRGFYRINLDADANQPCPALRDGRAVTVSEVHRLPAYGVIPNPADCQLGCRESIERWKAEEAQFAFFGIVEYRRDLSHRWANFAWAPYQDGGNPDPIRGARLQAPENEFWPCDLPIWSTQRPRVTVTCPP
jgi:hypothetical protein